MNRNSMLIVFIFLISFKLYAQDVIEFNFRVVDENGLAKSNASIKYFVFNGVDTKGNQSNKLIKETAGTTDLNGYIFDKVEVNNGSYTNSIKLKYRLDCTDYCPLEREIAIEKQVGDASEPFLIDIKLRKPSLLKHVYFLSINDYSKLPIREAKVNIKLNLINNSIIDTTIFSDIKGYVFFEYVYKALDRCDYYSYFNKFSTLNYEIEASGYYKVKGELKANGEKSTTEMLNLLSKNDYFTNKFRKNSKYHKIRKSIYNIIEIVRSEAYIRNVNLELSSIDILQFKAKDYLKIIFNDKNEYNSIKLNKYDIAKLVFDEVIRKILNPLNDFLFQSNSIDGYNIQIKTSTRNFVDKDDESQNLEYYFYLPKDVVLKYKNKDISGQQLIDKSIILLNDERIDLKLQ